MSLIAKPVSRLQTLTSLLVTASISTTFLVLMLGCSETKQAEESSPQSEASTAPSTAATTSPQPSANVTSPAKQASATQADSFRQAVNQAMQAATLAQSAQSPGNWDAVAGHWQKSIDWMKAVPSASPNHAIAQQKIAEYQRNLTYAQQQSKRISSAIAARNKAATQAKANQALVAKAKQFFNQYTEWIWNFDPAVAGMYAPEAVIRNTRRYPDGRIELFEFSAYEYRDLLLAVLPIAKEKGDRNEYNNVTYKVEGNKVRISMQRYSLLKNYTSPQSFLVGPDETGEWKIFEDISESRP